METCDLLITKPSEALFHLRIFIHATTFTCVQRQKKTNLLKTFNSCLW